MPDLVLSVPEPDISHHFLIQLLKILNQAPKSLIQRLKPWPPLDCQTGHISQAI